MTELQFYQITQWQKDTFPEATPLSKIHHLQQEVEELKVEFIKDGMGVQEVFHRRLEFADCFLLLYGAAAADGMSYQDIQQALYKKMEINYKRKWGKPDENGVVNHLK